MDDFDYKVDFTASADLSYKLEQVHLFRGAVGLRNSTSSETCFGDADPSTNPCSLEIEGLNQ